MTQQEALQQLIETNNQLVAMMTGDDTQTVNINGTEYPTFKKYIKDNLSLDFTTIYNNCQTEATNASNSASLAQTEATNASNSASLAQTEATNASNSASSALDYANQTAQDKQYMQAGLNQLYSLRTDMENLLNDMQHTYTNLTQAIAQAQNIVTDVGNIQAIIEQKAGEVKADKLTVVEYCSARPNQTVKEYSYSKGQLHQSPCANYSMQHYLQAIYLKASAIIDTSNEYIPLVLRDSTPAPLAIFGNGSNEYVPLVLRDDSISHIGVRGN